MYFSAATFFLSVLAASESVAAICQLPYTYSLTKFKPSVHQIFSRTGNLLKTIVSNNIITVKKPASGIPDGQIVRVTFEAPDNWIFVPERATFVANGPDSVDIRLFPVQASAPDLNSTTSIVLFGNYGVVGGTACSPMPDPGVNMVPITFTRSR